jgi:hypothetical protein
MYPYAPFSGRDEILMIRKAIDKCGRPIVLSLSPGPALIEEAWTLGQNANMWRITDDFWDTWPLLLDMFTRCEIWQSHVKPGNWPDCDMLPLGKIGAGFAAPRESNFTRDERKTLMTLWCIFRSPLMFGGSLLELDEETLSLIANPETLAVNREGNFPHQIYRDENEAVWSSFNADDSINIALFNLSDVARKVVMRRENLGLLGAIEMRDLWARKECGALEEIPPHGAALLKVRSLPRSS